MEETNKPKSIPNLGNTCFINACLQILLQTPELSIENWKKQSIPAEIHTDSLENKLWIGWEHWKTKMISSSSEPDIHTHIDFIHLIRNVAKEKGHTLFTDCSPNDISEFLLFFIETLHNNFKYKCNATINGEAQTEIDKMAIQCYQMLKNTYHSEYSEIMDIFYGVSISQLFSMNSENISQKVSSKPESFFLLNLQIHGDSIYDSLNHYTHPEYMENAWKNEKTGNYESVWKQTTFWNFPKILAITLQRQQVKQEGNQWILSKNNEIISFPLENLDVSKYVSGYHPEKYKYDLYAIGNHIGDINGGHYTTFVKDISSQKWYHCNDDRIDWVENPEQMITPMAYILFYRRKS